MQGGRGPLGEPGRGVYAVRRILAVLIILLLLVLLVPRACQALFGSGEEPGSGGSETAEVDSSGDEETVAEEDTVGSAEDIAEQEGGAVSRSDVETSSEGGAEAGEDGSGGPPNLEFEANFLGTVTAFDVGGGGADQIVQFPVIEAGDQPVVQPIVQEPIALQAPIIPEEPLLFEEPLFFGEPLFFEEPLYFGEPIAFEEPIFFEQQMVAEELVFEEEPIATEASDAAGAFGTEFEERSDQDPESVRDGDQMQEGEDSGASAVIFEDGGRHE